jgi:hypothetical protein
LLLHKLATGLLQAAAALGYKLLLLLLLLLQLSPTNGNLTHAQRLLRPSCGRHFLFCPRCCIVWVQVCSRQLPQRLSWRMLLLRPCFRLRLHFLPLWLCLLHLCLLRLWLLRLLRLLGRGSRHLSAPVP